MAFPKYDPATITVSGVTATRDFSVTLPPVVMSANGLLMSVALVSDVGGGVPDAIPTPAGWTPESSWTFNAGLQGRQHIFKRVADGTEGNTAVYLQLADLSHNYSYWVAQVWQFWEWEGTLLSIEAYVRTRAEQPNPPALTPGWPLEDTLWGICGGHFKDPSRYDIQWPVGFTLDKRLVGTSGPAGQGGLSWSALRELAASSHDPQPSIIFSPSGGLGIGATFAVRPGSAGSNPAPPTQDDLIADDILSSAPIIDQGGLSQVHAILANDILGTSSILDQATVAEANTLLADPIDGGVPLLDQSAISQVHAVSGDNLISAGALLDEAGISQGHVILGGDLPGSPPELAQGQVSESQALLAEDIETGPPALENAALGQIHVILGEDLDAAGAVLEGAFLSQVHFLGADNLISGNPILDLGTVSESQMMIGDPIVINPPTLDQALLQQAQGLLGDDLIGSSPILGGSLITQLHALLGGDLEAAQPILDPASLNQAGVDPLVGDDILLGVPFVGYSSFSLLYDRDLTVSYDRDLDQIYTRPPFGADRP